SRGPVSVSAVASEPPGRSDERSLPRSGVSAPDWCLHRRRRRFAHRRNLASAPQHLARDRTAAAHPDRLLERIRSPHARDRNAVAAAAAHRDPRRRRLAPSQAAAAITAGLYAADAAPRALL